MKRGISPLLSVVIIVGLTIITGIFVFSFGIDLINNLTGNNKEVLQEETTIQQEQVITRSFNTFKEIQTYKKEFITSDAIVKDNSIYYLTKDYLGSTRAITDNNGNKIYSQDYLPYGKELIENTNEEEHTYTSKEFDEETGLYYYGARYYNPNTGRFTQVDPIPSITSPYEAFRNNPIMFIDPDGRMPSYIGLTTFLNQKALNYFINNQESLSRKFNSFMYGPPEIENVLTGTPPDFVDPTGKSIFKLVGKIKKVKGFIQGMKYQVNKPLKIMKIDIIDWIKNRKNMPTIKKKVLESVSKTSRSLDEDLVLFRGEIVDSRIIYGSNEIVSPVTYSGKSFPVWSSGSMEYASSFTSSKGGALLKIIIPKGTKIANIDTHLPITKSILKGLREQFPDVKILFNRVEAEYIILDKSSIKSVERIVDIVPTVSP